MPVQQYDIAVANGPIGHLQFFVVGANSGQIYTCEVSGPLGPNPNITQHPWAFLGGPTDTLQLAVAKNSDGLLELFALTTHGGVWHNKQTDAAFYDRWGQWTDIGAVDWKQIIIGTNADGRLEVFALVGGGQAVHIWQESPSGNWSASAFFNRTGWKNLSIGRNADGRLELFAIGPDDSGYHLWQVAHNNGWSDWVHLGGVVSAKQLTVISNPDGRLELFILTGGDAWHVWQTPLGWARRSRAATACQKSAKNLRRALAIALLLVRREVAGHTWLDSFLGIGLLIASFELGYVTLARPMADNLPRNAMPKMSGPASRAQPLLGALVPTRNPGNDKGYPVHVHVSAALEERPGSLKRLLSNHSSRARREAICVLIVKVPPLRAFGALTRFQSSRSPCDASQ